jgi:hypothetical protein
VVGGASPSPSVPGAAVRRWLPLFPFPFPACQAAVGGVGFPNTFFSETFPLTCALCLVAADVGSSGKSAFDNLGGACLGTFIADPGLDDGRGSGTTVMDWLVLEPPLGTAGGGRKPEDALADQGVVIWGFLKGLAWGVTGAGKVREDDELAACATRSKTCREDR